MQIFRFIPAVILCLNLVIVAAYSPMVNAQSAPVPPGQCFNETGKCVRGLFNAYWADNGGLAQQGFPVTDEFNEINSVDGKLYRVQYFERGRFEYHPANVNTPFVILLGQLGRERYASQYLQERSEGTDSGELCFPETRRCISTAFYNYWKMHGGLAQHGYPLSAEFQELNAADNQTYRVQYFERGRFEYHPDKAGTPFEVLLGHLGRENFNSKYPNGQPVDSGTVEPINIYRHAMTSELDAKVAGIAARVYVPNENGGDMTVIDPASLQVVDRFRVGNTPHHATPSWDMSRLYVNNMGSNSLTEINPRTARPVRTISIPVPYNLYYTLDGTKAIVAAEPNNSLDFYNPQTWQLIKRVYIPWPGIDHMDMSADGRYLMASTEYGGVVVKVDTVKMEIVGAVNVGGLPVDVRLSPDGTVFLVANQSRNGVSVIDPVSLKEIEFIATGTGAHGMQVSRDTKSVYVTNRLNGTVSVIDFATRQVRATWNIGGSPDMLQISPDGTQLWASGRYNGVVYVIDTRNGALIKTIAVGNAPHGIAYFPQPGRFSIGHNGVYR